MARSSGPSSANAPRCGNRPIKTTSRTLKSNDECVSCGTKAIPRATSRRDQDASGLSARRTVPLAGCSIPPRILSSVVFPEPFGPMTPTRSPRATASDTSSRTGAPPPYAKETLSARSNPYSHDSASAQRGIPKHFLVFAVGQVETADEDVEVSRQLDADTRIEDRVARIRIRAAGKIRLEIERFRTLLNFREACQPSRVIS